MSYLKRIDSNSVLTPITLCIAGKKYDVKMDSTGNMFFYSVLNQSGELCLCNGKGEKLLFLEEKK
jgi:hypothetical protein